MSLILSLILLGFRQPDQVDLWALKSDRNPIKFRLKQVENIFLEVSQIVW